MVSRADRGPLSEWLWTVDHYLLAAFMLLMIGGVVLSFAASPPVAERLGVESFFFVKKQATFLLPSMAVMLGLSLMTPRLIRRAALFLLIGALVLLVATLFVGFEVKGGRRWIDLGITTLQPSEFLKPAFIVIVAFLLSESGRRREVPGALLSALLFAISSALLIAQPDFGQTMLMGLAFGALFFINGMPWAVIIVLAVLGVVGMGSAYLFLPHVTSRINRFLDPESGDTFQVDTAREAFLSGGWFGKGPGEGVVKRILPDSHTDFVFSVVAEEFGIIVCMLLVAVFAFIILRGLRNAARDQDAFARLATSGLVVLFGLQAMINLMVNLNLVPAKGMTLPFISYGGSSTISTAITAGFILALTRRKPQPKHSESVIISRVSPSSLMQPGIR
ncbi:putative lipid II flippase FtsW [Pannonibacter tanglangensis]|uniref:Probable peptidoglycan glycosyltransferase FtsW n=1 Tax=Pannonibacter tanglangensis TaxID=2750084 RepID=A0ABW9ZF78_9HYPH|nr:putative lipid II flippase FtsW [Pannonibacter sp. XCT-34]NBN63371.1 putative lipid II flippase FtsW [Pannonibacter sp. XCT-34]